MCYMYSYTCRHLTHEKKNTTGVVTEMGKPVAEKTKWIRFPHTYYEMSKISLKKMNETII